MPRTRVHLTDAQRQRAYRQRRQQAVQQQLQAKDLPPGSPISSMPGRSRWNALIHNALASLEMAHAEMENYCAGRSEPWQEGDRGQAWQEYLESLAEITQALTELETQMP